MKMKLVTIKDDYADEFNVVGQRFFEDDKFDKFVKELKNYNNEITICFGTNEYLEFYNGNDVFNHIRVVDVDEVPKNLHILQLDQFNLFEKLFCKILSDDDDEEF
jgi:hypothetical protein